MIPFHRVKFFAYRRPQVTRFIGGVLIFLVGALSCLSANQLPFLRIGEAGIFRLVLGIVQPSKKKEAVLEGESFSWDEDSQVATLTKGPFGNCSFVRVPLAAELFNSQEPRPAEIAVLLAKLRERGVKEVALTQPLTWEAAPELEFLALEETLKSFQSAVMSLRVANVAQPAPLPEWFSSSLLSSVSLLGEGLHLPEVNDVNAQSSANSKTQFAFSDLGERDSQFRTQSLLPLLVRCGDGYLVSWPLRLVMLLEGIGPEEISFEPGHFLRVGSGGPVIPIDQFGRARLDPSFAVLGDREMISAQSLFALEGEELPKLNEKVILVMAITPSIEEESLRLIEETYTLLQYPYRAAKVSYPLVALHWQLVFVTAMVLVTLLAFRLSLRWQRRIQLLLVFAILGVAIVILNLTSSWMPVFPFLPVLAASYGVIPFYKKYVPFMAKASRWKRDSESNDLRSGRY